MFFRSEICIDTSRATPAQFALARFPKTLPNYSPPSPLLLFHINTRHQPRSRRLTNADDEQKDEKGIEDRHHLPKEPVIMAMTSLHPTLSESLHLDKLSSIPPGS